LKIKIVTPEGEQVDFEADTWEFSQNKFENEDVVLIFHKMDEELENTTIESSKPSKLGVLSSVNLLSELLKNTIGEEKLKKTRDEAGIVFIEDDKSFVNTSMKRVITETYDINIDDNAILDKALGELIIKEKELSNKYQLKVLKEPVLKFDENKFYIEEELSLGEERTEV